MIVSFNCKDTSSYKLNEYSPVSILGEDMGECKIISIAKNTVHVELGKAASEKLNKLVQFDHKNKTYSMSVEKGKKNGSTYYYE
jgi:hypothetical protein